MSKCECCGELVRTVAIFTSRVTTFRVYLCARCLQQLLEDVTQHEAELQGKPSSAA